MPATQNSYVRSWRKISRKISNRGAIAFAAAAVACGGGSDMTGTGGGGGGPTPVASVAVSAPASNLLIGVSDSVALGTTTATATPKDASGNPLTGKTVSWSSSATNIATVTASGVVTGVGAGTATIIATSGGKTGQVSVIVTRPAVATVTMAPTTATLLVGVIDSTTLGSASIAVTPKDAAGNALSGRTVTWVSATPGSATVSSTGVVKGVAAGASNITATIEGQVGTTVVTVARPPVTQLTVTPQSSSIKVGATETLAVALFDAQGHPLTGRLIPNVNNSTAIITVSTATGAPVITGVSTGTGTVNFTSEGVTTVATIGVTP